MFPIRNIHLPLSAAFHLHETCGESLFALAQDAKTCKDLQLVMLPLGISLAFATVPEPLVWYSMIFHDICTTTVTNFQQEAARPRQSVLDIEQELF